MHQPALPSDKFNNTHTQVFKVRVFGHMRTRRGDRRLRVEGDASATRWNLSGRGEWARCSVASMVGVDVDAAERTPFGCGAKRGVEEHWHGAGALADAVVLMAYAASGSSSSRLC